MPSATAFLAVAAYCSVEYFFFPMLSTTLSFLFLFRHLRNTRFCKANCAFYIFYKQTLDYRRYLAAVLWQLMFRCGNLGAKACLC